MSNIETNVDFNSIPLNDIKPYVEANAMLQLFNNQKGLVSPKLFIQGKPGIGKSDIVKEFCKEHGFGLVVKYMSNMLYEMMTGLPIADTLKVGSEAQWSKPNLFSFTNFAYLPSEEPFDKDKTPIVLLIDDVHLCDKNIQKFLFQLLTYRSINDYTLPCNVILILAGNRIIDKAGAHPIPAPICNRLIFMDVTCSVDDWIQNFALHYGIRDDIITFVKHYEQDVLSGEPTESAPWPSPRSWTFLSDQLTMFEKIRNRSLNVEELKIMCNGLIGCNVSNTFIAYCKLFSKWNYDELIKWKIEDVYKYFDQEISSDGQENNPIVIYSIINSVTSYMIRVYKSNDHQMNDQVKKVVQFTYKVYTHFLDEKYNQSKTFIISGMKYILDIKNNVKDVLNLTDYFIDQLTGGTEKDNQMFKLLSSIFSKNEDV